MHAMYLWKKYFEAWKSASIYLLDGFWWRKLRFTRGDRSSHIDGSLSCYYSHWFCSWCDKKFQWANCQTIDLKSHVVERGPMYVCQIQSFWLTTGSKKMSVFFICLTKKMRVLDGYFFTYPEIIVHHISNSTMQKFLDVDVTFGCGINQIWPKQA